MSDSDERMRILKMIEDHNLTPEEGAKLIAAMADGSWASSPGRGSDEGKWMRIRVTDLATGRSKASVQIPIALMDAGMKIGAQFVPDVEGVDMTSVIQSIRTGATGKIIDVNDDTDGEHVEIFVD